MNCKNCGAPLAEGSLFCGNCGMRVETEQGTYEAQPQYEDHSYEAPQEEGVYTPTQPAENYDEMFTEKKPNTVLWIILSAVELVMCCPIGGIVGLIFSILAHVAAERGAIRDANYKLKVAKICFWVGLALGVLFIIAYIALVAIGTAASFAEGLYGYDYYY